MDIERILLTLLDDTDRLTVAETMRKALAQPKPLKFIAAHQDDDNPRIRRHVQQLNSILHRREVRARFIAGMRNQTLSFWDGLQMVCMLSDPRSNEMSLAASFEKIADIVKNELGESDCVSTAEMLGAIKGTLHVPRGFEFFNVFNLFLCDIYETRNCHPLVLCELARELGKRHRWYCNVVIYGGMYMLATPEGDIVSPNNDWNTAPDLTLDKCHICTNEEMLNVYLALIHVFAVITRRPIGVYNFTKLIAEIQGLDMDKLPYPLGNVHYKVKSSGKDDA